MQLPTVGFLYIAGWIGTAGRDYLIAAKAEVRLSLRSLQGWQHSSRCCQPAAPFSSPAAVLCLHTVLPKPGRCRVLHAYCFPSASSLTSLTVPQSKPREKEIIIDVPSALKIAFQGAGWPFRVIRELQKGTLVEDDKNITVSPR